MSLRIRPPHAAARAASRAPLPRPRAPQTAAAAAGTACRHEDALLDVFDDEDHLYMVPNTEQFVWPLAKATTRPP